MKTTIILLLLIVSTALKAQNIQKVVSGKIEHIENFKSQFVESRNIDIWLPEEYDGKKKFAVLYMHDGQMLFDSASTWNKQSWDVDDIAGKLMKEDKVRNFIVVGVWNIETKRHENYFPQKPFENLTKAEKDTLLHQLKISGRATEKFIPNSDNYLKFLVTELKPFVDHNYSVYTERENTFIAGSSMGGLISIYAICEYPSIFGGSASLSTHWIGSFTDKNNPIPDAFINYLKTNLPPPKYHKIYFDCGDQTLDAFYPAIQRKVDAVIKSMGYSDGNWLTKYFKGKDHTEKSWNERFHIPLIFLLGM